MAQADPNGLLISTSNSGHDPTHPDDKEQLLVVMVGSDGRLFHLPSPSDFSGCFASLWNAFNMLTAGLRSAVKRWHTWWERLWTDTERKYQCPLFLSSLARPSRSMKYLSYETDWTSYIRTKVDDVTTHFKELLDFVGAFSYPRFTTRPPFTRLRKIANQILVSECRTLLSLQPVAERLDARISAKIHEQTGMPYIFNSRILTHY
ncbi:hypothetical protein R3P38DRAFT_3206470 [Favolaschia claudopus]|uniref:Uncharacterized protein n=1 Tax=Favolaschia claudopus TaxID=2862362 RepID=A0AAW0ANA6_9AGAR